MRNWIVFQVLAIVMAAALVLLTWDSGKPFYAQPFLVPFWIAISPLILMPVFLRQRARPARRGASARGMLYGMLLVEIFNMAGVAFWGIPWSAVLPILAVCIGIQIVAVFILIRSRKYEER